MSETRAADDASVEGSTAALVSSILAVPGVDTLYPAASPLGQVATAIGSALTTGAVQQEDVLVAGDRIRIRIGVDGVEPAAEVCRRVYDVASAWAASTGRAGAIIDVTAATIGA